VEGTKEGLIPDLEQALTCFPSPLAIINGPLMDGMKEVGRLFNDNQLIVAEVLQSAEVMKAAVSHLEPHMEKDDSTSKKGKILLATVKGDVHDIGKNLVDIILSNNGYDVIDLGIKVSPTALIEAIKKEDPTMVGLSGLLVRSAQQMVVTAHDMKQSGIDVPILVGGAALSRKFTEMKISAEYDGLVLYAKDAMDGLSLANRLMDSSEHQTLIEAMHAKRNTIKEETVKTSVELHEAKRIERSNISTKVPVFVPKDTTRHVLRNYTLAHIEPYINKQMLLGHHLGVKGKIERLLHEKDEKTIKVDQIVSKLMVESMQENWILPEAIYQFFPAQSDENSILIYDPDDQSKLIERFDFPRQEFDKHLCLADYLKSAESGMMDYVGFFAVTTGNGVRTAANTLKEEGRLLESHALQALALEAAEGFAELIHRQMRDVWGFPDPVDMTMQERFSAKYQGQRFSFGYPACPNLEDQRKLFILLHPEEIGIHLTDGLMMEPEGSVSAIVFAHPNAKYFNVRKDV
jgi:5-methyltetrahydrofolate--homocysteine methyltransferase